MRDPLRRIIAIAALTALLLTQYSLGTSAIILQKGGKIAYLAADSLTRNPENGQTKSTCKINKSNRIYWTAATNFFTYHRTGFDLKELVHSVGDKGTVTDKMHRFIKVVTAPLERAIYDSRKLAPLEYERYARGELTPLEITFVAIEHGEPTFVEAMFVPQKVGNRIVVNARSPLEIRKPTGQDPLVLTGLGFHEAAFLYLQLHSNQVSTDPIGALRQGLQAEAKAHPEAVAEPFSILRIDEKGGQWMDEGLCH